MTIDFFIPGEAVPKGRGRAAVVNGRAHVFTPSKTRDYENLVKSFGRSAMEGRRPLEVPVAVSIAITLPIPSSMPLKHQARAERGELLPAKRPDLDNCCKAITDGMNSIILADDKLICELHVSKRYGRMPGVHVQVVPMVDPIEADILAARHAKREVIELPASGVLFEFNPF